MGDPAAISLSILSTFGSRSMALFFVSYRRERRRTQKPGACNVSRLQSLIHAAQPDSTGPCTHVSYMLHDDNIGCVQSACAYNRVRVREDVCIQYHRTNIYTRRDEPDLMNRAPRFLIVSRIQSSIDYKNDIEILQIRMIRDICTYYIMIAIAKYCNDKYLDPLKAITCWYTYTYMYEPWY